MTVLIRDRSYGCKRQFRRFKEAIMAQSTAVIYFPDTLMGPISVTNGDTGTVKVMQGL